MEKLAKDNFIDELADRLVDDPEKGRWLITDILDAPTNNLGNIILLGSTGAAWAGGRSALKGASLKSGKNGKEAIDYLNIARSDSSPIVKSVSAVNVLNKAKNNRALKEEIIKAVRPGVVNPDIDDSFSKLLKAYSDGDKSVLSRVKSIYATGFGKYKPQGLTKSELQSLDTIINVGKRHGLDKAPKFFKRESFKSLGSLKKAILDVIKGAPIADSKAGLRILNSSKYNIAARPAAYKLYRAGKLGTLSLLGATAAAGAYKHFKKNRKKKWF